MDGGAEGFGADPVGVPLGDLEQRLDQGVGQQVGFQAQVEQRREAGESMTKALIPVSGRVTHAAVRRYP